MISVPHLSQRGLCLNFDATCTGVLAQEVRPHISATSSGPGHAYLLRHGSVFSRVLNATNIHLKRHREIDLPVASVRSDKS